MHVVMRSHPNTEVADILVRHKGEIEETHPWIPDHQLDVDQDW